MPRTEPYADVDDLPEEEVREYSKRQRAAFENAFDRALENGKKEDQALREAHVGARQEPLARSVAGGTVARIPDAATEPSPRPARRRRWTRRPEGTMVGGVPDAAPPAPLDESTP